MTEQIEATARRRWPWVVGGVAAAALVVAGTITAGLVVHALATHAAGISAPSDRGPRAVGAPSPRVDVDGPTAVYTATPVSLDGDTVTTACFQFRLPHGGWEIDPLSDGCAALLHDDIVSDPPITLDVQVQTGGTGGDVDLLAAATRDTMAGLGYEGVDVAVVVVAEMEVVRLRWIDAAGRPTTSYQVPVPRHHLVVADVPVEAIWVSAPAIPGGEAWLEAVVGSLELRERT